MDLFLDGDGSMTKQLFRALRQAILEGRVCAGTRLPPSRDLARSHGVSRGTVVAAYELLRAHGLATGRQGSGTFVATRAEGFAPPGSMRMAGTPPQTAYARRARDVHDHATIPGRRVPGARIDFQYGMVTPSSAIQRRWCRMLAKAPAFEAPGYPNPQGLLRLRRALALHIARTRGIGCQAQDILIVSGVQQATSLAARVVLEAGDVACVEEPGYFSQRRILQMHGAQTLPGLTDADGLRVDLLGPLHPKLICVTPSHQFPTGVVLSGDRRRSLLAYARQCGAWILEDDYDGEFRQDGPPQPALKAIDEAGSVIYVGSFSKTLFAALRIGYMVLPPGLARDFVNAKWAQDFGCSTLEQALLAELIESGEYDKHLRRLSAQLREKRGIMSRILHEGLGGAAEVFPARTGMHLLVWIRGMSTAVGQALTDQAAREGLGLHPVTPCFQSPPTSAGFLMGFGGLSARQVAVGTRLFCDYVRERLPAGASRRSTIRLVG